MKGLIINSSYTSKPNLQPPSGLSDNARIPDQIALQGYACEEFALFRGRAITRAEYDDGAAVIDGNVFDLNGEALLQRKIPYAL